MVFFDEGLAVLVTDVLEVIERLWRRKICLKEYKNRRGKKDLRMNEYIWAWKCVVFKLDAKIETTSLKVPKGR
jgi:hypothetical protein